jgi:hypothetical protein
MLNIRNRDHAVWDEEQEQKAKEKVAIQLENPVPEEERGMYANYLHQKSKFIHIIP